ncbi:MAG TPA: gluconate 2-dehydrogenase subunit 3 family protein [Candidatus Acidoferrum sp.]|nr:gluconate 2-dehydrogenase subunit 3 family protein [Candidatus Acidoferrum sp.]
MAKDSNLGLIRIGAAAKERLTRREMVGRLLAGAGAGASWPLVVASHPIHECLANAEIFEEAEKLGAANWKPVFLNPQQNETLSALSESIVPGSAKAQVNRFLDLLLSVDKPERQQEFVESLAAFESESQKRFGKQLPSLDASQKDMLLTDASAQSLEAKSSEASAGEKHSALGGHFENLKGWISGAYYSSEVGVRELGWTGDYVFESFPGCTHPDEHG